MCVIMIKDNDKQPDINLLQNASLLNPDGLGIVWLDTNNITYHDSDDFDILYTERPYIAHFRYATVGEISIENCHPFPIGNTGEYLMQNGTIKNLGDKSMTDTEHLASMLAEMPRYLWRDVLEMTECRFVITDMHGYDVYNEHLWHEYDGIWLSKDNVIPDFSYDSYGWTDGWDEYDIHNHYVPVAVYGTLKKGHNNYYRYLAQADYVGRGVTAEKFPLVIQGLPYLLNDPGKGHNVEVDVFYVTPSELEALDRLEGHPEWYYRQEIVIKMDDGTEEIAYIYFNDEVEDKGEYHETYKQHYAEF